MRERPACELAVCPDEDGRRVESGRRGKLWLELHHGPASHAPAKSVQNENVARPDRASVGSDSTVNPSRTKAHYQPSPLAPTRSPAMLVELYTETGQAPKQWTAPQERAGDVSGLIARHLVESSLKR